MYAERRSLPPRITRTPPAAESRALARRLRRVESRNVTFVSDVAPIFWDRAEGSNVWDADGNRYVDLTSGFGVAAVGHRHPRVVEAMRKQIERLVHGLGDVHPPDVKVALLEALAERAPMADPRAVLCTSGSEAVEVALKTAYLKTGKPGVLAFRGAYHGTSYGGLAVTQRAFFRAPFEPQLNPHVTWADYPDPYRPSERLLGGIAEYSGAGPSAGEEADSEASDGDHIEAGASGHDSSDVALVAGALSIVEQELESPRGERVGAIIVEPIQGRAGEVVPPPGFLAGLARLCRDRGLLLVADEIYTGFGRTGQWLAVEAEGVIPDLLCVGKALSGGMPIAACVGSGEAMEAWPESRGEAIHTSTFQGHPVACAAALAAIRALEAERLPERAGEVGARWLSALVGLRDRHAAVGDVRGKGLLIGLDVVADRTTKRPAPELASHVVTEALRRGWILVLSGAAGNVLSLSPPLDIDEALLERAVEVLDEILSTTPAE